MLRDHVPPHRNIVALLGTVGPAKLTKELTKLRNKHFPIFVELDREGQKTSSSLGVIFEYLPMDLADYLQQLRQPERAGLLGALQGLVGVASAAGGGRPDRAQVLHMTVQVLSAVTHLESHSVLHLDIKPNNFLVSPKTGPPRPSRRTAAGSWPVCSFPAELSWLTPLSPPSRRCRTALSLRT